MSTSRETPCMYECMYVWMYIRMSICMYVCMYVHTYVRMSIYMYVCTYVRMFVSMYVYTVCICIHSRCVWMYVWMYVYTYLCMYVCKYVYMYVCQIWYYLLLGTATTVRYRTVPALHVRIFPFLSNIYLCVAVVQWKLIPCPSGLE